MTQEEALKQYLPLSESLYFILLSLTEPRHGYGILLYVKKLTAGARVLETGTIYNTLSRLVRDGLAEPAGGDERRTLYQATALGLAVLRAEAARLETLCAYGRALVME